MADRLHHERLYRGADALARLRDLRIVVCGAGALGSNIVEGLARQGCAALHVIDDDRVEEHNIGTQVYGEADIGALKVDALRNRIFRAVGVELGVDSKRLTADNAAKLLRNADCAIDAFDNSASRAVVQQACRAAEFACVHTGMFEDYGEVVWDERYQVPSDVGEDVCDYPLARNLAMLTATVTCESVMRFALSAEKASWSITLRDLQIKQFE